MTWKSKIARALRKWADLIDPKTEPRNLAEFEVKVLCDVTEFNAGLEEIRRRCLALAEAAGPKPE